ncbi:unnamed protein product [Coccothraustes coccothraustes]
MEGRAILAGMHGGTCDIRAPVLQRGQVETAAAEAMVATTFLLLLVQGLLHYLQWLDEAALERMQLHAEYLNQQMTWLMQELEQKSLEQSTDAWGALLRWQFWTVLGILVLLLRCVWTQENEMQSRQQ